MSIYYKITFGMIPLTFAKKRLLVNILSFLEKDLKNDFVKKVAFNRVLEQITTAYSINYKKEKAAITDGEDLIKIFQNRTKETSMPELNRQLLVNSVLKFFVEECTKMSKIKSFETILNDFENLVGSTSLPRAYKKTADKKDLLQVFTESQVAAYQNRGYQYITKREYNLAIKSFTIAINYAPTDATLFLDRATAHHFLKNYNNVIWDCLEAIRLNPYFAKAYNRLGMVFILLKRYQESVDAYQKALDLEPGNEQYRENLKIAKLFMAAQAKKHS